MSIADPSVTVPTARRLWLYGLLAISGWLIGAISQLAHGWWLIGPGGQPLDSNYVTIWAAGRMALAGQAAASYAPPAIAAVESALVPGLTPLPWLNPPTFLLAAAPLALLPYLWSCVVWLLVTGACYVAAVRAILPYRLGVVLAFAAPAAYVNLVMTETGFADAALIGAALLCLPSRPILVGIALGLQTFKPQLGLLFPLILLAAGQWRAFASAAIAALLLAGATAALFGADAWTAFLTAAPGIGSTATGTRAAVSGTYVDWPDIQSWYSVARYLGAGALAGWVFYGLTVAALAGVLCWFWRGPAAPSLKAAAVATGCFLATPYVMAHDATILVVAAAFLVRHGIAEGFRRGDVELCGLTLFAPLFPLFIHGSVPLMPAVATALLMRILHRPDYLRNASSSTATAG